MDINLKLSIENYEALEFDLRAFLPSNDQHCDGFGVILELID